VVQAGKALRVRVFAVPVVQQDRAAAGGTAKSCRGDMVTGEKRSHKDRSANHQRHFHLAAQEIQRRHRKDEPHHRHAAEEVKQCRHMHAHSFIQLGMSGWGGHSLEVIKVINI
jgi:hypothetical protein